MILKNLFASYPVRVFKRLQSKSMSNKHKIAICQITNGDDKDENYNVCKSLILQAKEKNAKMIFLPESFDYVAKTNEDTLKRSESIDGPLISAYRDLARTNRVWLSLGGLHRRISDDSSEIRVKNSHVIIDDGGEIRQIYDKLHLFEIQRGESTMKESDFVQRGDKFCLPVLTSIGKLGALICFDLRFPQQSTLLRQFDAEILTYPSVFTPITGEAHWHALLRARAIENQCYVIAAAQVGKHNQKRSSYGHSLVVDPWGRILCDMGEKSPAIEIVEIDLDLVHNVRKGIPLTACIRNDIFALEVNSTRISIDKEFYMFGTIKIPNSSVFYETEYSIGLVNLRPIVPGHVMIIPKEQRKRVADMKKAELKDLILTAQYVSSVLEKHFKCTSINFGIQDGPEAGQSVSHVHLHILPRKKGDFKRNDDVYDKLHNHDKDESAPQRSIDEMKLEAIEFRQLFGY